MSESAAKLQAAIVTIAKWMSRQTVGPLAFQERSVVRMIGAALVEDGVAAYSGKRIKIPNWTTDDLEIDLVIGDPAAPTALAEFKWSETKLDHLLWDLVKMSNGAELESCQQTFVGIGTSQANWNRGASGCELVVSADWDLEHELQRRPGLWDSLREHSECCPTEVARFVKTESLLPVSVDWGSGFGIRVARVLPLPGPRLTFGHTGFPTPTA